MNDLGRMIKQRRMALSLTVGKLADVSGISASHLGRIERAECLPSAHVLQRIAKPLGLDEGELFILAGFLPSASTVDSPGRPVKAIPRLDSYVANVLAEEPLVVQRSAIGVLNILKSLAKSASGENSH